MQKFEVLEHTADIGIRAQGRTLGEAFANAADGMFSIVVKLETVAAKQVQEVEVEAEDSESLLVEWLNELLYRLEAEEFLACQFIINDIGNTHLKASVGGEKLNPKKHKIKKQIKACTYHQLKVEKTNSNWTAQVIFDV